MTKRVTCAVVIGLTMITAASAQIIRQDELGDNKLTCDEIVTEVREMEMISAYAQKVTADQQNQYSNNQGSVGGLIKAVGDLMDSVGQLGGKKDDKLPEGAPAITPSNAWQVSYEAEARRNRLVQLHQAKDCE